jgi:NitT/TauT family transport system ATP-binding protein
VRGRILADEPVPFPRPRTVAMTYEPAFVALNQRLRGLIVEARAGHEIALGAAA